MLFCAGSLAPKYIWAHFLVVMLVNVLSSKQCDETGTNATGNCFKPLDAPPSANASASKHRNTAKIETKLKNLDDRSNIGEPGISLTTNHLQLKCTIAPPTPRDLKPKRFKLSRKISDRESGTPRAYPGRIEFEEDSHVTSPAPQSLPGELAVPLEHTLNLSPHFYRGPSRDSVFGCGKEQVPQESRRLKSIRPLRRHATSSASWAFGTAENASKSASGFGCQPKSERVSLAPNSKATSTIYKNEYKSLIASSDVNRIAHLQKSRLSVTSANSPSRLRALMMPKSECAILSLIRQR